MPNKMLPRSPRLARLVQLRRSAAAADECPTRVRRLVAPDMVTAAYGRGADARVPAEIVDYAGGARSVEWASGETRTYVSEADMWRALDARASNGQPHPTSTNGVIDRSTAPSSVISYDGEDAVEPFISRGPASAREAWATRPAALAALLGGGYAPLAARPEWVAVPGEDDGRVLDTLGRRNGTGRGRQPTAAGTLRA